MDEGLRRRVQTWLQDELEGSLLVPHLLAALAAAERERDEANAACDRQADMLSETLQRLSEARSEIERLRRTYEALDGGEPCERCRGSRTMAGSEGFAVWCPVCQSKGGE